MYHVAASFSPARCARTLDNRSRSHQHQSTTGIGAHFPSAAAGGRMLPTQRQGRLDRVYGGATRPAGRSDEGSFAARSTRHIEAKRAIAQLAASLVEP